jgi:hypothetical protein
MISIIMALTLFMLTFASCQSEIPNEDNPNPNPNQNAEEPPNNNDTTTSTTTTTTPPPPEPRTNTDFRNTKWGDSPEAVVLYETAKFEFSIKPDIIDGVIYHSDGEIIDFLAYNDTLSGLPVIIFYNFDSKNRLYSGVYSIGNEHTTTQFYISDYDKLKKNLINVYGNPYYDEIIQLSSLASYTDAAGALTLGYVAYIARWKTDITEIELRMFSNNYEISTGVIYKSIEIIPEADLSGF